MEQELSFNKETIEISGGRKLYDYKFTLDGRPLPPMSPEDLMPGPTPTTDPEKNSPGGA